MGVLLGGNIGGGILRRAGGLFDGLSDPVLRAWWDTTDSSDFTITNGKIEQWADKSPNGYNLLQSDETLRPTIAVDGRVSFATSNKFNIPTRLGLGVAPDFAVIVIFESTDTSNITGLIRLGGASSGAYLVRGRNAPGFYYFGANHTFEPSPTPPRKVLSAYKAAGSSYAQSVFRFNGVMAVEVNSLNGLGVSSNSIQETQVGETWAFECSAIAVLNSSNIDDIERWEGFLAHRHNATDLLAVNHPYKIDPPGIPAPTPPPPSGTPTSIETEPTVSLYLDGLDASTITTEADNVTVNAWADKSFNSFTLTQTVAANQPVLSSSGGLYLGIDQFLEIDSRLGLSVDPDVTVIMVAEPDIFGSRRAWTLGGNESNNSSGEIHGFMSKAESGFEFTAASGSHLFPGINNGSPQVVTFIRTGGAAFDSNRIRANGTELVADSYTAGAAPAADSNRARFTLSALNASYRGDIHSVVVLGSTDQAAIERIEGDLARQYNILGDLDASHPFKTAAPY